MRVILADSNELIQEGLKGVLNASNGVEELVVAGNHNDLIHNSDIANSDVVIIDFVSEGFSIDSINAAQTAMNQANILAITNEQSAHTIVNALKAGVKSYVKKSCSVNEILDAVEATSKSEAFFCGQIVEAIQAESINIADITGEEFTCEPIKLSARELEIIEHIAEGYTNGQIAEKLFLSAHTINTHRKNIMGKLGVNNTAAIVMYAVKTKLISPNKFLFNAGQ